MVAMAAWSAHAADAKAAYEQNCAKCHGADGKGATKMGQKLGCKDYTDAKVQADLTDAAATKAIKDGLKDKEDKVLMKPAEGLSDDDIKAGASDSLEWPDVKFEEKMFAAKTPEGTDFRLTKIELADNQTITDSSACVFKF